MFYYYRRYCKILIFFVVIFWRVTFQDMDTNYILLDEQIVAVLRPFFSNHCSCEITVITPVRHH